MGADPVPASAVLCSMTHSVGSRVRDARKRLLAGVAIECALTGFAAAGMCLAAAIFSRSESPTSDSLLAATAAALFAAGAWWLEHRVSPIDVARSLDRELGFDGAILTAFELEDRVVPTSVGAALVARVACDFGRRTSERPKVRVSPILLALALLAGAAAASAFESREPLGPQTHVTALARRLQQDVRRLLSVATSSDGGQRLPPLARERIALLNEMTASVVAVLEGRSSISAGSRERLQSFERDLSELGPMLARERELRSAWSQALTTASALRSGLETAHPRLRAPDTSGSGQDLTQAGEQASSKTSDRTATSSSGAPAMLEAGFRSPDSRIDGGSAAAHSLATGDPASEQFQDSASADSGTHASSSNARAIDPAQRSLSPAAESGISTARWWPKTYDQVVERWVEIQRTGSDRRSGSKDH